MTASGAPQTWDRFSVGYTEKVFTTLQFAQTRRAICRAIQPGNVLDMGCGPVPDLLHDLIELPEVEVYASDFSQAMLDRVSADFRPGIIKFVLADNRSLPFAPGYFDTVISVNSILPEDRKDVDVMFREVWRVLKPGGRLVALLPAFETSVMAREAWGLEVQYDAEQHREYDTTGWQSFYTEEDIRVLMAKHQFYPFELKRFEFNTDEAIEAFRAIYGKNVSAQSLRNRPMFEHFLVAHKPSQSSLR